MFKTSKKVLKTELILKSLIQLYILKKTPIASKDLFFFLDKKISQSSIRHHLQYLTNDGLLNSEHFSSGKFPTDKALRLFSNAIVKEIKPNPIYTKAANNKLDLATNIARMSSEASKNNNMCIVVSVPSINISRISKINIVQLSQYSCLVVGVSTDSLYTSMNFISEVPLTVDEWQQIEKIINAKINRSQQSISNRAYSDDNINILNISKEIISDFSYYCYFANSKNVKQNNKFLFGFSSLAKSSKNNESEFSLQILNVYDNIDHLFTLFPHPKSNDSGCCIGESFNIGNKVLYADELSITYKRYSLYGLSGIVAILAPKVTDYEKSISVCQDIAESIKNTIDNSFSKKINKTK